MGTRTSALADQFEKAVADFAQAVESCSDATWGATCRAEGWTVAQTAQHVSGQFPLEMEFIRAAAEGSPLPAYSMDDVNEKNDTRAAKNASAGKADVLRELRDGAASTAAYIRSLSDDQLDKAGALPLAGGANVTTQQLIEGPVLIAHVTGHLESIRNAG